MQNLEEHEPLLDRAADQSRVGAGIWHTSGSELSKTKGWFRISGTRRCHFALGKHGGPNPRVRPTASSQEWVRGHFRRVDGKSRVLRGQKCAWSS